MRKISDEMVSEAIRTCRAHLKKYGLRKMSLRELDELAGIK